MELFGLAGPAEAAIGAALGLLCIGIVLTGAAALLGLLLRSRLAAAGSAVVGALTTFVFLPWQGFWPNSSDDPDVHSFQATFRTLAGWWVAATVASASSVAWTWARPRPAAAPTGPQMTSGRDSARARHGWVLAFRLVAVALAMALLVVLAR